MAELNPITIAARNGHEVTIRSASRVDALAIRTFGQQVLSGARFNTIQPHELSSDDEQVNWIVDHIESPGKLFLVVSVDGEIVGNLVFTIGQRERLAHSGYLGMSLLSEWRSKGIGRALLTRFFEWANENEHIEKVRLEVFADNKPAIALYQSFGFVKEGLFPRNVKFAEGDYVDVIAMCKFTRGF